MLPFHQFKTLKTHKLSICMLFTALVGVALIDCARAEVVPSTEVFGQASDGTVLHWLVYTPATPGPWPAVLVIHAGLFTGGTPDGSPELVTCSQDLAAAG